MMDSLAWGLQKARDQTLQLIADIPSHTACDQAVPGELHPTWITGHLLLADIYLLFLLGDGALPDDFQALLDRHGPSGAPGPEPDTYESLAELAERLTQTGIRRQAIVSTMSAAFFSKALPDPKLARAQPTMGHHLQALVFHEGYHAGQLAAWRKNHGLPSISWAFAMPME